MFFRQMPYYQLLHDDEHFKLRNFKCYKTRFISLCNQKEGRKSDNTTKERYLCRPNLMYNICPITLQNKESK